MSDDETNDNEQEEIEDAVDDDEDDDDDLPSYEEEYAAFYQELKTEQERLRSVVAPALDQAGQGGAARVVREIAGGFGEILMDVVATTAQAIADAGVQPDGSYLEADDAKELYSLLVVCERFVGEHLKAAEHEPADTKEGAQKLVELIQIKKAFILEVSEWSPDELPPAIGHA